MVNLCDSLPKGHYLLVLITRLFVFACRNTVAWNFKRLLRVVFSSLRPLSNVWIDQPLMPSSDVTTPKPGSDYTLNVRSRGKQLVLFSQRVLMFPETTSRETNWFPEGPDIKCFVILLDFHFNSNKRITGANQNSRLGTYNNTSLILKTTEWMIHKQKYFPHIICIFFLD